MFYYVLISHKIDDTHTTYLLKMSTFDFLFIFYGPLEENIYGRSYEPCYTTRPKTYITDKYHF